MTDRRRAEVRLLLISIASLYFELLLVRWLPTEVRVLAYFSNVTLMSCILGLGMGALLTGGVRWPAWLFPLLTLLILVASLYHGLDIALPLVSEGHFVWNGLSRAAKGTPLQYVALFGFFALNTAVFIPIGHLLGRAFDQVPPLPAYLINVSGALIGLSIFALFSWLLVPPFWWFVLGLLLLGPFVPMSVAGGVAIGVVLAVAALESIEPDTYWSPYYKVTTRTLTWPGAADGLEVSVNEDSHQQALDLSGRFDSVADLATRRRIYDEPYRYGRHRTVLVLGAGTGNDVAAALRNGATHVDAVEIDPVIVELGRLHPERPYEDPRVIFWNREARTFLRNSGRRYDAIVLGYVDSHSLFSAMSSVRLDNFVYTREAFREFRDHLAPGGVLAVTFTVHERWIADRIHALFRETFGTPPLVFQGAQSSSSGTVFLGGDQVSRLRPDYIGFSPSAGPTSGVHGWRYAPGAEGYLAPGVFGTGAVAPTDDWPYLYLRDRSIPTNYLLSIAGLLLLSILAIRATTGSARIRWPFFFLGAAFLLVETKAMTELAIFLGSTWTVNFFVIAAVLSLIVLGTVLVMQDRAPSVPTTFVLLGITILGTYLAPLHDLLSWDSRLRDWVAAGVLCLPLFFAAIVFARLIRRETMPSAALGSNLLGAVVGGALEYSSLGLGFRTLHLFALALYALAWLTSRAGPGASTVAGVSTSN